MDISNFFSEMRGILRNLVEEEVARMSDEEIREIKEKYKNKEQKNGSG